MNRQCTNEDRFFFINWTFSSFLVIFHRSMFTPLYIFSFLFLNSPWSSFTLIVINHDHLSPWSSFTMIIVHHDHFSPWSSSTIIIIYYYHHLLLSSSTIIIINHVLQPCLSTNVWYVFYVLWLFVDQQNFEFNFMYSIDAIIVGTSWVETVELIGLVIQ